MSSGTAGTMTQQQPQPNAVQQTNGTAQNLGGKKPMSGGSSGGPTPAGTPVQNGTGPQGPSPPPLTTNAPKYGTLVPNRIFVGGIAASTTEGELMQLFSVYGTVKAAKIIQDRAGVSKGYGFITFESEDDARRPLRDPDNIVLRERRLNIAPAIKKQPFGRPPLGTPFDPQAPADGRSSAPAPHQSAALQQPMPPFFIGAATPFYTGPAAYYGPAVPPIITTQAQQQSQEQANNAQPVYQGPPLYPGQTGPPQNPYASMMFPQTIYMPQQYSMMPYEYAVYSTGAGAASSSNGAPPYGAPAPPSGGGNTPPRGGNCFMANGGGGGPPDQTTIVYGPPPPPMFHPAAALDAPPSIYASPDGSFDPMMMGHFAASMGGPYGMSEDGSYMERPAASATPRSYLTATPPAEPRSTATPVVSMLNFEQQQEKDPAALQGGRRPPQQPPHQVRRPMQQPPPPANGNRRPFGRIHNTYTQPPPPPSSSVAASFGPPIRRPRKPPRRPNGSGVVNEIGAGDAPLPSSQDDALATQVDALKI